MIGCHLFVDGKDQVQEVIGLETNKLLSSKQHVTGPES